MEMKEGSNIYIYIYIYILYISLGALLIPKVMNLNKDS